jgi:hypothetical protein
MLRGLWVLWISHPIRKMSSCRQHCAPHGLFKVAAGRSVIASMMNWSCLHCRSSHAFSSLCTVNPYLSVNSHRCDTQHLLTYLWIKAPSQQSTSHDTPACSCKQSISTWRLLPTILFFWRCLISSLFLLDPCKGIVWSLTYLHRVTGLIKLFCWCRSVDSHFW